MVTVTLPDSTYERLKARAAERKLTIDAFLDELAGQGPIPPDSARQLAAIESFVSGMTRWTATRVPAGQFADDSRESIYEGRGG